MFPESPLQKQVTLKINGMHCGSCEVLIERKFKEISGVEQVSVNAATGEARLTCSKEPSLEALNGKIKEHGYSVFLNAQYFPASPRGSKREYFETGAVFLIIFGLYLLLKQFDILPKLSLSNTMSYGFIFAVGLVAAFSSCIAVTGGLLLAVAAKYNERNPHLSSAQKFRPHLAFNIGRIASYTVLGGLTGALGSFITLSPAMTGVLTIIVSLVMLILGFQLLNLFPRLQRFQPKMPKFLAHRIHNLSERNSTPAAFSLGAATFFLPCGFTQALQLYVLSRGDFTVGALTMLIFSLGTLPALLSLSALSSFMKGSFQRYFLKTAGAVVILLGFFNINNGLALTGARASFASLVQEKSASPRVAKAAPVSVVDGKQLVSMRIDGLRYTPHTFTVVEDIPVEWRIDGRGALGCSQVMVVPKLGITQFLDPKRITAITFTPREPGTIEFSCSMGMTTRGSAFTVLPNPDKCDSRFADCLG